MAVSPGFRPDNVLTGQMTLPDTNYPDVAALLTFRRTADDGLDRQPGVLASGFATNVPLSGISNKSAATARGYTLAARRITPRDLLVRRRRRLFRRARLLASRGTLPRRRPIRARPRASASSTRTSRDGIGPRQRDRPAACFRAARGNRDAEAFRIVGVVGAVKQAALTEDDALGAVYYPFGHRPERDIFVVTRTPAARGARAARCGRWSERSIRSCRSPTSGRWTRRIADSLVARRSPALLAPSSPRWRCCSPPSAPTAS